MSISPFIGSPLLVRKSKLEERPRRPSLAGSLVFAASSIQTVQGCSGFFSLGEGDGVSPILELHKSRSCTELKDANLQPRNASEPLLPRPTEMSRRPRGLPAPAGLPAVALLIFRTLCHE